MAGLESPRNGLGAPLPSPDAGHLLEAVLAGELRRVHEDLSRSSWNPDAGLIDTQSLCLRLSVQHGVPAAAYGRTVLCTLARRALPNLDRLRVDEEVRLLFREAFSRFTHPQRGDEALFDPASIGFGSLFALAGLRRFPAGQLDWVVGGIGRRDLLRVPLRHWLDLGKVVWGELGGRDRVFFTHVSPLRKATFLFLEGESRRSYLRIARTLQCQPEIRGTVTISWFHDPRIADVSPHLSWTNSMIHEGGGKVIDAGMAPFPSDALTNSRARTRLWQQGEYVPRLGLVLWPRNAMLKWAGIG